MTRTERQRESIKKWIANKGRGTVVAGTGVGKTHIALMTIQLLLKKHPQLRVLVVVPTETLKKQWIEHIEKWGFQFNVEVGIINTIVKHTYTCDFLILDEEHRYSSDLFRKVFDNVKYKLILGLTATFERLDGKHVIANKYCPVIDNIPLAEAIANGWVSEYKEYQVLIDVDDIETYKNLNKEWLEHFEFFGFDFNKAMSCSGKDGWRYKLQLRDEMYKGNDEFKKKQVLNSISYHSAGFMRTMTQRKAFINNHPKKIEIAKKIIEARQGKKIITFSNNVKMAESISNGKYVYTGKVGTKKGRVMVEDFISGKISILNSCQKLNEGFDCPDVSVAIILGFDSSETKAVQRRGRAIRAYENKEAEVFYIVINGTQETKWMKNSHSTNKNYITIDEKGLEQVLNNETPDTYKPKIQELLFRF